MKPAPALQRLQLRDCQLTGDGLELIARARAPRLRHLDLAGNAFGAAIVPLLAAPSLAALETLDLRRCGAATIAAVATAAKVPPRLARLDLRENELGEAELLAIADAPALRAVAHLVLDGHVFTFSDAGRARLAERFGINWYDRR
jgi:hypothetical protein